jgi:hypothetical protein
MSKRRMGINLRTSEEGYLTLGESGGECNRRFAEIAGGSKDQGSIPNEVPPQTDKFYFEGSGRAEVGVCYALPLETALRLVVKDHVDRSQV